jgi:hypothetical protein
MDDYGHQRLWVHFTDMREFRSSQAPLPSGKMANSLTSCRPIVSGRDFDQTAKTLSITKARVYGVDRNVTKTREDRVIELCPRAVAVLERQLALHDYLRTRGRVDHDQMFFQSNGHPIRSLAYSAQCWRKSSERLGLRVRRPYSARDTSVSWNLMIRRNPLWVSRQHGHSLTTMFRTYAAWTDGALESDIELIRSAMQSGKTFIERLPGREDCSSGEIGHWIGHWDSGPRGSAN